MIDHFYSIIENTICSDKQKNLPYQYSIIKIQKDFPFDFNAQRFTSLSHLKRYSKVYNEFKRDNPKGARKICENRFILDIKDFILTPNDEPFSLYAWDLLNHTIYGKIEKDFSGIHLISNINRDIKSIIETKPPDKNGIWEAEITVFSTTKNKEFSKISTLFPKSWDPTEFMFEIHYAIQKMIKKSSSDYVVESKTKSGIPVEIVLKNDKILSVYPIYSD
jgi:hypothetical protein